MTDSISEMERQEQEALAALKAEFPQADIRTGCDHRFEVRLDGGVDPEPDWSPLMPSQWWEYDTLPEVRQRIVWALANR